MASTAFLPEGTDFKIGDGASPTEGFISVANCTAISLSGAQSDEIDVTNLKSANRTKEFIAGYADAGQIELTIHFNPAETSHAQNSNSLWELFQSKRVFNWKVEFPVDTDTCTISGRGFIRTEPGISFSPTSPLQATVTVRRTGTTDITVA